MKDEEEHPSLSSNSIPSSTEASILLVSVVPVMDRSMGSPDRASRGMATSFVGKEAE